MESVIYTHSRDVVCKVYNPSYSSSSCSSFSPPSSSSSSSSSPLLQIPPPPSQAHPFLPPSVSKLHPSQYHTRRDHTLGGSVSRLDRIRIRQERPYQIERSFADLEEEGGEEEEEEEEEKEGDSIGEFLNLEILIISILSIFFMSLRDCWSRAPDPTYQE